MATRKKSGPAGSKPKTARPRAEPPPQPAIRPPAADVAARLELWGRYTGFVLREHADGRWALERGERGWRKALAFGVRSIHSTVHVEGEAPGTLTCTLVCAGWIHLETPSWWDDDRAVLRQDFVLLLRCLGSGKEMLDELTSGVAGHIRTVITDSVRQGTR